MPGLGKWWSFASRPNTNAHTASTDAHTAANTNPNTAANTNAHTTANTHPNTDPTANTPADAHADAHAILLRWRCRGMPQFCGNVWWESVLPRWLNVPISRQQFHRMPSTEDRGLHSGDFDIISVHLVVC